MIVTRFAPSPTGPLHLGHAYSALIAHDFAMANGGKFLLRIEDIDQSRARRHWEEQIYDDLHWLGIGWDTPVRRQSDHLPDYRAALNRLATLGVIYPCNCSRSDIEAAANAPQEGVPTHGPDGRIYPNTCRHRPMDDATAQDAIRLNMQKAMEHTGDTLFFDETGPHAGRHSVTAAQILRDVGDVVLARRGMGTSYHLSVVVDDALQSVTHVVRGLDLFEATHIHVVLQRLLALPTPTYHHHDLIRDEAGKRLAKRHDAKAIAKYRSEGATPNDIRAMVGLSR